MPTDVPIVEQDPALLRHPRLATLATSAWPAWLWSADGTRLLWANAVGAAIFGAATVGSGTQRRFDAGAAPAGQIVRLAATLPSGGHERLERLRGFGSGLNRALTCVCSRIVIGDGTGAVLIAAAEPAGPALTLAERLRRLFAERDQPLAAFSSAGTLVYANAAGQKWTLGAPTLAGLGLGAIGATAFETGGASGSIGWGGNSFGVTAMRLGKADDRVVVFTLTPQAGVPHPAAAPLAAEPLPTEAPETAVAPSVVPPPLPAAAAPTAASGEPLAERRHPLRFVWQIDADGRFGVGSDEFAELVGPHTMAKFGRLWSEIAADLKLDPENRVARAIATRETWSGVVIAWPVDDSSERLPVELSGLPVFDRDRSFRGYRGFGVCRDIDRINALARARRERPIGFVTAAEPQQPAATAPLPEAVAPGVAAPVEPVEPAAAAPQQPDRPASSAMPAAANVVPFRQSPSPEQKSSEQKPSEPKSPEPKPGPTLSPVERRAFRELAQELTARLRAPQETLAPVEAEITPAEVPAEAASMRATEAANEHVLLDRVPVGILVYRHDALLFANRHFLEWSGYESIAAIEAAGGLHTLFVAPGADALAETGGAQSLSILTERGNVLAVDGRMFSVPWNGASALALILTNGQAGAQAAAKPGALDAAETENRELKSILDAGIDGIVTLDGHGRIVTANARAADLFGRAADHVIGLDFVELLAPESGRLARDYFDRIGRGGNVFGDATEVMARGTGGRPVPWQ